MTEPELGRGTDLNPNPSWEASQEMSIGLIILIAVAVVALLLLVGAIRIVREYERVVVFRLGRLRGARGPGLVLIIPLIERTRSVNLQVDTADIPAQDLITKDNVTVRVEAAVFFRVVDPVKAVVAIRDYQHGVLRIAQTTLRGDARSARSR